MRRLLAHSLRAALQVPMLLRRGTFCDAYVAQARVFRTYSSWVLAMLLSKVRARPRRI